jgi:hypothetical protein
VKGDNRIELTALLLKSPYEMVTPMSDELVTIATFPTAAEAGFVRSLLEAEGIPAYVADEGSVTMLSGLSHSLGWVKVRVAAEDCERAGRLLEEYHQERGTIDEAALTAEALAQGETEDDVPREISTCVCPGCGREVMQEDGTCGFCGAALESAERLLTLVDSPAANADAAADDEPERDENDPVDEMAARALRAAGIGLIFCPATLYAALLVGRLIFSTDELSAYASKRLWLAFLLTLVGLGMYYAYFRIMLAGGG